MSCFTLVLLLIQLVVRSVGDGRAHGTGRPKVVKTTLIEVVCSVIPPLSAPIDDEESRRAEKQGSGAARDAGNRAGCQARMGA
jgi:hypothetical protein